MIWSLYTTVCPNASRIADAAVLQAAVLQAAVLQAAVLKKATIAFRIQAAVRPAVVHPVPAVVHPVPAVVHPVPAVVHPVPAAVLVPAAVASHNVLRDRAATMNAAVFALAILARYVRIKCA
jgi:hypothetical protein